MPEGKKREEVSDSRKLEWMLLSYQPTIVLFSFELKIWTDRTVGIISL